MKSLKNRCKSCGGYCCTRDVFDLVYLYEDEVETLRALGAEIEDDGELYYMKFNFPNKEYGQACKFLKNGKCSIYNKRPRACEKFDCEGHSNFEWILNL